MRPSEIKKNDPRPISVRLALYACPVSDFNGASKVTVTSVKPSERANVVSIWRVLSSPRRVRPLAVAVSFSLA